MPMLNAVRSSVRSLMQRFNALMKFIRDLLLLLVVYGMFKSLHLAMKSKSSSVSVNNGVYAYVYVYVFVMSEFENTLRRLSVYLL